MALEKKDHVRSVSFALEPDGRVAHLAIEHGFSVMDGNREITRDPGQRQLLSHEEVGDAVGRFLAELMAVSKAATERRAQELVEMQETQDAHAAAERAERERARAAREAGRRPGPRQN